MLPGITASQCECLESISVTDARCFINSGRFSSLRQNAYTSSFGLFTIKLVLMLIADVCDTPLVFPMLLYNGQLPEAPLYNKNPPKAVFTNPLTGCLNRLLIPEDSRKAPKVALINRSFHPTLITLVPPSEG